MALVSSGLVNGSAVKRTASPPSWTSVTVTGFFFVPSVPSGGPYIETHFQFGGGGGFLALQVDVSNGLKVYHDWGSWGGGVFVTLARNQWHAISMTADASRLCTIRIKDMVTGVVSTTSGTNPTWSATMQEMWLGNYTYGNRSYSSFAGMKMYNVVKTIGEIDAEWGSVAPVSTSGLIGNWIATSPNKATALTDGTATGNLIETGTSFTVDSNFPSLLSMEQEGFRFFNDDGSQSGATGLGAQDANVSVGIGLSARLRMLINATGDPPAAGYKLQYRKVGGPSWKDVN